MQTIGNNLLFKYLILFFLVVSLLNSQSSFSYQDSNGISKIFTNITPLSNDSPIIKLNQDVQALPIKVVTYNVHTLVDPEWRDVVIELDADVVVLQETGDYKSTDSTELVSDLDYINERVQSGPYLYYEVTNVLSNTAGNAIISRFQIKDYNQITFGTLDNGEDQDMSNDPLHAIVNIYDVDVHFITYHLNCCATGGPSRMAQTEALMNYADSLGDVPIIFAGDLNTISGADAQFNTDANLEIETVDIILNEAHPQGSEVHTWIDVFRTLNPGEPGATQHGFFSSRIDYIFANEFFFDKLVNSTVITNDLTGIASDHSPVEAIFNFNPTIDITPPIQILGVDAIIIDDSSAEINWIKGSENDISFYSVYRNDEFISDYDPTTSNHLASNLDSLQLYNFQISATDDNNNTGFRSFPLYLKLSYGVLTSPRSPVLTVTASSDKVVISWTLNDDGGFPVDDYAVLRATDDSLETNSFKILRYVSDNTYTDESLQPGRSYHYKVYGRNLLGNGLDSELVSITVPDISETEEGDSELSIFVSYSLPFAIFTILKFNEKRRNIKKNE